MTKFKCQIFFTLFILLLGVFFYAMPTYGQEPPSKVSNLTLTPNKFYAGSSIPRFALQFTLNDTTNVTSGYPFELHFPKNADKTIGAIEEIESRDFTITGPSGSEGRLKPHSYTRVVGDPHENILFFRVDGNNPLPAGTYTIQFPQFGITTGSQQDSQSIATQELIFLHAFKPDEKTSALITILAGSLDINPNQAANNELIGSPIKVTLALLDKDQNSGTPLIIPKDREWKIIFPAEFNFLGGLSATTLQPLNGAYPFTIKAN